jgi:hypothetical protein
VLTQRPLEPITESAQDDDDYYYNRSVIKYNETAEADLIIPHGVTISIRQFLYFVSSVFYAYNGNLE